MSERREKQMQYMFSLVRDDKAWESSSEEEKNEKRGKVGAWIMEQAAAGRVQGGGELRGAETATTIRFDGQTPLVMDGPFIETREVLGGFVLIDVADLDEAIALAKTFPLSDHAVEIRPTVPMG
jgi:hypothetical protein